MHSRLKTDPSRVIKYRPEIDGLRAIAVVSVILFHAGVPGLPGGYVGVDVFFVISGYLITGILLKELSSERFSIVSFYERRARRILPALFLVLTACLPLGWVLMDPYSFWRMGQGIIAVTAFVSNILFWKTTNYFTANVNNPLLHTWSLGVEEQFYIFFPLFLWLVWRYIRNWLWLAVVFVTVLSFVISQWGVASGRSVAAFYLSPARVNEILLGSIVALAAFKDKIPNFGGLVSGFAAWLGFGAIIWSVSVFNSETPFPGWYALVPSVGTAMILAFANQESVLGRLLSQRIMVGVGLISYSAYLWHQPIFTFVYIGGWRPGLIFNLGLALISLLLAWASWYFVENPFRDRKAVSRRQIFYWSGIFSLAMLACGAWITITHGVSSRFTIEEMKWWRYSDVGIQSAYVVERFNGYSGEFTDNQQRKILVMGDSFAQDFVNMAHEAGVWTNDQIRTVYIPAVCQMASDEKFINEFVAEINRPICSRGPNITSSMAKIEQADIIVLAASWAKWSARLLPRTIASMNLQANQSLFVIGSKNFGDINIPKLMSMSMAERMEERIQISSEVSEVNMILKNNIPADIFVDQVEIVCDPDEGCPLVTNDDNLISYDGGHLTQAGAEYIGVRIFKESALSRTR